MKSIPEQWDDLKKKQDQVKELYKALDASYSIQAMWNDAFKHGRVISSFKGNLNEVKDMKYVIKNAKEEKEFDIADVPLLLIQRLVDRQIKNCNPSDTHTINLFNNIIKYHERKNKETK